jgi:hypothetical protein
LRKWVTRSFELVSSGKGWLYDKRVIAWVETKSMTLTCSTSGSIAMGKIVQEVVKDDGFVFLTYHKHNVELKLQVSILQIRTNQTKE